MVIVPVGQSCVQLIPAQWASPLGAGAGSGLTHGNWCWKASARSSQRFDVIRRILESSTVSFYVVCVLTLLGSPLSIFAVIKNLE